MSDDDFIDVDPDTGEILEPPTTAVDVYAGGYRPTLVIAPQAAREMVEQVKELQRSVLVQGSDYMTIPGTPKPSLLKPGAERLLMVFGLGHHFERLELEQDDGRNMGVTYRCIVTRAMPDGQVITVSSCDGHASSEEPKWRKAPWNTILKMAQKRALVGAALTATATSGLFTQDIEDYDRPQQPSRGGRPSSDTDAPRSPDGDPNLISKAQIGMMLSLMAEVGITAKEIRLQFTQEVIGREIGSAKELTKREASAVIDRLKEMAAEEAGAE